MRKWIVVAVVVLVVAGLAAFAVRNLNAYLNNNKDWIAQRVESALGRQVSFDEIGVSLLGGFGAQVSNFRIADDPAYSEGDFVRAKNAVVRIRILPALFGRYEVARIVLESPSVTIVRTEEGLNSSTLGTEEKPAEEPESGQTAAFLVAYVSIEDGQIRYIDRTVTPPSEIAIEKLDFSATDVSLEAPVKFELGAAVLGSNKQNAHATGSIGPFGGGNPATVPLDLEARVESISTTDLARIQAVAAALPQGLNVSGPVSFDVRASGTLADTQVIARLNAKEADVVYGQALHKETGVPMEARVDARRTPERIEIADARLAFHTAEANAKGMVTLGDIMTYDVRLTTDEISLAGWDRVLPSLAGFALGGALELDLQVRRGAEAAPQLDGVLALEGVSARKEGTPAIEGLSTRATMAGDKVTIEPASFTIGGAPVRLTANVDQLEKPTVVFQLTAPALPAGALGFAAEDGSEEVLRDVQIDGTVRTSDTGMNVSAKAVSRSGRLRDVDYSDLSADVRLDDGRAVLDPIVFEAFGGTLRAEGIYDMRNAERPAFNFESKVQSVNIGDVLSVFAAGAQHVIEGNVDANLSFAGAGNDWDRIQRALVGGGQFSVVEGLLKDVNLVDGVLQKITGIPGLSNLLSPELAQKYPRIFSSKDTYFDKLEGQLSIADGKLVSDNLSLRAADFSIRGSGGIGFDRSVDLKAALDLSPGLSQDLIGRVGVAKHLADRSGRLQIPFKLAGTLPGVRPQPDMSFVSHAVQRAAVEGLVGDILQSGKKKTAGSGDESTSDDGKPSPEPETPGDSPPTAEDQIRKGIEGLFGR